MGLHTGNEVHTNGSPFYAVIYSLREQRMGLVQSVEQYKFIFKVLHDFIEEELHVASGSTSAKRDNGLVSC
jgi:protein tyrosine phosphatase